MNPNKPQADFSWYKEMKAELAKEARNGLEHFKEKGFRSDIGDRTLDPVEFARVEREHYVGEVGKRRGNYLFHFFGRAKTSLGGAELQDAFLATFRIAERLSFSHDRLYKCNEDDCPFKGSFEDLKPSTNYRKPNSFYCPDCHGEVTLVMDAWSVRAQGFADNPMAYGLIDRVFDELDKNLNSPLT